MNISNNYLPRTMSKKDKETQRKNILRTRKSYKKGIYINRKTVKSFKSKPSPHIQNAMKMYDVTSVKPSRELSRKTKCSLHLCTFQTPTFILFNNKSIKLFYHLILMENTEYLHSRIQTLEDENSNLKEQLKKYTAPTRSKVYYENHKDDIIKKVKEYKEKTNYKYQPTIEQKQAWARTAYINKKKKNENIINNDELIT